MIYTIGHKSSYERYFAEQGQPRKLGRTPDYPGGSVWETAAAAQVYAAAHTEQEYAVYGVLADWNTDTAPTEYPLATWRDLLVTSDLVRLTGKELVEGNVIGGD